MSPFVNEELGIDDDAAHARLRIHEFAFEMGNESSVFRELVEAHIHVEMDFYESGKQKLKEKEVQQSVEDRCVSPSRLTPFTFARCHASCTMLIMCRCP